MTDPTTAAAALAALIARNRFGSGVDMGGAHNPRPSETRMAQQFIRDLTDAGWCAPAGGDVAAEIAAGGFSGHIYKPVSEPAFSTEEDRNRVLGI